MAAKANAERAVLVTTAQTLINGWENACGLSLCGAKLQWPMTRWGH